MEAEEPGDFRERVGSASCRGVHLLDVQPGHEDRECPVLLIFSHMLILLLTHFSLFIFFTDWLGSVSYTYSLDSHCLLCVCVCRVKLWLVLLLCNVMKQAPVVSE